MKNKRYSKCQKLSHFNRKILANYFSHKTIPHFTCESNPEETQALCFHHYLLFIAITAEGVDRYLTLLWDSSCLSPR